MKIWVDADACPSVIKEILFKAANRTRSVVTLVANRKIKTPRSSYIFSQLVGAGPDVADKEILDRMGSGDVVITADIPLAAEVIEKGGTALNPRGELYTEENVKSFLSVRDFNDVLRSSGLETGGPPPMSKRDIQKFANNLDKLLVNM